MTAPAADKGAAIQRRVLIGTLSNLISKVLNLGTWFFLTPFILGHLGASTYGMWILVSSVVAYGNLLDFGVAAAVTKYVADFKARGQLSDAQPLVATALWLYAGLGLAAFGLSVVLAPLFPALFDVPPDLAPQAQRLVVLSGAVLGLSLPCAASSAILRGLQRFDLSSLIGTVGMSLYAALTVAVLLGGGGVEGLVALNLPLTLFMQIPTLWLIHRAAPELRLGVRGASRKLVRLVFSYSSALFVINVAGQLQTKTDEIVIGAFMPVANVTPYSLARRLSELPNTLTDQFMRVLMPLAAQLHAEADEVRLRGLYITSTRLTLAIGLPMVAGLALLSRPFLLLWVGPEFANSAAVVIVLVLASWVDTSQWPASSILQGMARHRPLALLSLFTGLANLLISVVLVGPLGVLGVALGTLIPAIIESWIILTPYSLRQLGVSVRTALRLIIWPALAPAVPLVIVLAVLDWLLRPASYLALACIGAAGAGVYALGYLALTAGQPEHIMARQAAGRAGAWLKRLAQRSGPPPNGP